MQELEYSKEIKKELLKEGIKIGERIRVIKNKIILEGILLPKGEFGDKNSIVLKLDSGYNIGIKYENGVKIEKAKTSEPKKIKTETEIELGKIKEKFLESLKWDETKPKISLIATGGTIASRVDYKTGGVYMIMKPEEFLYNIPELRNIVKIQRIINPFNKASEDMDVNDWKIIAKNVANELNKSEGVIITHGTDTLHFTSAALSFMLRKKSEKWDEKHSVSKPVVLVGAQRSSDRGSSDTAMNLICSSYLAISDIANIGICMHGSESDDFCYFIRGTKVRKMHTSRRDAFKPINEFPIAKIWNNGKIEILNKNINKRTNEKVIADLKFNDKIAILKAYPGSEPKLIKFLIKNDYQGIIIEGTGLGHVPIFAKKSWTNEIKNACESGVFIGITSQTIFGRVNKYVYRNLRILSKLGSVHLEDMLTEVAYIKLGYILGHTKKLEKIKSVMLTNISNEITERSIGGFIE